MNLEFLSAKDGNLTCKLNSVYLHSAYSPLKESERFVSSINSTFKPEIIFLVEPGISYCVQDLKKKFPDSKTAVIRLIKGFEEYNSLFDYVFNLSDYPSESVFFSEIFNLFGENILAFSLFLTWEASAKIFPENVIALLQAYKSNIEKSHSILKTRSFFEKRWIKNSLKISINSSKTGKLEKKGNCPVVICASGPSLKKAIPFLKEKKPYIIAVSSALRPLFDAGITPDLVLSTDGGYWAKKHLDTLKKCKTKLVLAVEGNVPAKILKNTDIIPLIYSDGVESSIFHESGKKFMTGLRCGTVSGTALDFAKQISSGPVYFTGLDLCVSKGFQHTQNNNLELLNCSSDTKFYPKEKRLCSQSFSNQKISLKIYEDWFATQDKLSENVFRVIENPNNKLGKIKDIFPEDLKNIDFSGEPPLFTFSSEKCSEKKIKDFIQTYSNTREWLENVFTADYLNYLHTNDENIKENLLSSIQTSNADFIKNLCRRFTEN